MSNRRPLAAPMTAIPSRAQLRFITTIGFGFLAGCSGKSEAKADSGAVATTDAHADEKGTEQAKTNVAVTVAPVSSESFSEIVSGSGEVAARTGHVAALAAPAPARISAVHVTVGDRVRAGANLISFETTSFDAAVSSAEAALNAAEQAAARAKRLVDAGIAPRKEAEAAAAELATARSTAATARRTLQLARMQSPINGVVTRLNAVLGANADIAQTLVEISDTQSLDVLLVLSPAITATVHSGQSVTLRDGAGATTKVADGRIVDVSAVVDSQSRGVIVRVAINSVQRPVRIGETLIGQVITDVHKGVVVIADDALVPTGEGVQVFVVDDNHKAHARSVTVGGRDGHRVWIADGLKAGERIVTAGAYGLDEGTTVVEMVATDAPTKEKKAP